MQIKNEFAERFINSAVRSFERGAALLIIFCCSALIAAAQVDPRAATARKTLESSNSARGKNRTRLTNWSGTWTRAFRHASATIKIEPLSGNRFRFDLSALSGVNDGAISGVAAVRGNTAQFDDRKSPAGDIAANGCKLTFVNKNNSLSISETAECTSYGGVGVVFGGDYGKGKSAPDQAPGDFVRLGVFPNARLDRAFKSLVGKDYERFLGVFHLVAEETNADDFAAKVFSGCVRGICPTETGIIMFNRAGKIWAAVTAYTSVDKAEIRYYTNDANRTNRIPATIENWRQNSIPEAPLIYRTKSGRKE